MHNVAIISYLLSILCHYRSPDEEAKAGGGGQVACPGLQTYYATSDLEQRLTTEGLGWTTESFQQHPGLRAERSQGGRCRSQRRGCWVIPHGPSKTSGTIGRISTSETRAETVMEAGDCAQGNRNLSVARNCLYKTRLLAWGMAGCQKGLVGFEMPQDDGRGSR